MTETQIAAMRQALEALTNCTSEHGHRCNRCDSEVDANGEAITALRAALAEAPAVEAPEGWQLVPVEPTGEMKAAPAQDRAGFSPNVAAEVYRAMLDAAPKGGA